MKVYADVGIQEYWLLDWRVPGASIERYLLDDSGEFYCLHDTVKDLTDENQEINVISFPNWVFRTCELMKHVYEYEIMD